MYQDIPTGDGSKIWGALSAKPSGKMQWLEERGAVGAGMGKPGETRLGKP